MANILIIDDDSVLCDMLSKKIGYLDHTAQTAPNLEKGMPLATSGTFEVVLLDVRLPDGNGLTAIPSIKQSPNTPDVIIITGEGDPNGAELAIKNGAWDYLEKPVSTQQLALQLTRVLQYRDKRDRIPDTIALDKGAIVCDSPPRRPAPKPTY